MGWLTCHKKVAEQHPQFIETLACLAEEKCETTQIGGLKEGVTTTHVIQRVIPLTKEGKQRHVAFGLTKELPINTLCGLGFQITAKMKTHFATQQVESALPQASLVPSDSRRSKTRSSRSNPLRTEIQP
jgi:hypothetical protein